MRGVPGSGKSTIAKILAGDGGSTHSTDDFFYVDGEYRFNPKQLSENHDRNFTAFCHSLSVGIPIVICDNTNIKHSHFDRYVIAATQAGYFVAFVVMPHPEPEVAARRTIHKVPATAIARMINEWEN